MSFFDCVIKVEFLWVLKGLVRACDQFGTGFRE